MTHKSRIKTAIIPAAGYATRFLPATKSTPKELFPILNKPVILHVVEEAVVSGIEHIIFITGQHKQSLEAFFTPNESLEQHFLRHGKIEEVGELKRIQELAHFTFVPEQAPYGNGAAVLSARHLIAPNEPFVVVWGDEFFLTDGMPRIKQCIEAYERHKQPIISAVEIADEQRLSSYGIAAYTDIPGDPSAKQITHIVEKPDLGKAPSHLAVNGAYVLTPEIFEVMDNTFIGKDHELWLTDALNVMKNKTGLVAKIIPHALYLDCGTPLAYLKSQIQYALRRSENADELRAFLREELSHYQHS